MIPYDCVVLMDAENGDHDGWGLWDDDPPAEFRNSVDPDDRRNRVIELLGGYDTGYQFRTHEPVAGHMVVQWRMRMDERFYHYVFCETSEGNLHLRYTPGKGLVTTVGKEPVIGLELEDYQERWVVVRRDLLADFRLLYPEIEVHAVRGMNFRGRGCIDDIRLYSYADKDHDLLPDEFEKREGLDPRDPGDASLELVERVIALTNSPKGKEEREGRPEKEDEESVRRAKRRKYRVGLDEADRRAMDAYFNECLAKRLAEAPRPQVGRTYRVCMQSGEAMVGQLEGFADGWIALRTEHGTVSIPVRRVDRDHTLALFPNEAARCAAMQDVKKRADQLIDEKIAAAERAAAERAAAERAAAERAAAAAAVPVQPVPEATPRPLAEAETTVERPVLRRVGKPRYDVAQTPTPEEIKPALAAFGEWLEVQHRRVGGRIAGRIYAKEQEGNAVLYMIMDPAFMKQDYDVRERMAVGMQQFWAFRCQATGVASAEGAHLVMVSPGGCIVGGSRPEDASDVWADR